MSPRLTLFALVTAVMLAPLTLFAQLQPTRWEAIVSGGRLAGRITFPDSITHQVPSQAISVVSPRFTFVNLGVPNSAGQMSSLRDPASAASADSVAFEPRSASTAFVLSFLIAGGGQLYAGETKKGVLLMLAELGGAGLIIHDLATCDELLSVGCNETKQVAGAVLVLGSWIYSMVDAPGAARRYNEKYGRAQPIVDVEPGGAARFGVRVALGR
jgi:hypothetical protein